MTEKPSKLPSAGQSEIARRFGGFVPRPATIAVKPDVEVLKTAVAGIKPRPARKTKPKDRKGD